MGDLAVRASTMAHRRTIPPWPNITRFLKPRSRRIPAMIIIHQEVTICQLLSRHTCNRTPLSSVRAGSSEEWELLTIYRGPFPCR